MMNILYGLDVGLFHWINSFFIHSVADVLMAAVTSSKNWMPVFVLGLGSLLWKGGFKGRICVLALLITVSITDPFNSRVIKPAFARQRPSHALAEARVLVPDNGGASFPSSHAANMFAAAFILSSMYSRRSVLWYTIAFLVAYSRVYVGVHYPSDVIAGAFVGTLIAWVVVRLFMRWEKSSAFFQNTSGRT
jgi:undecaprenyl-diphosphatase